MANLIRETMVTPGDNRLKPDLKEKMLKEHAEWEKYKNRHNYSQVKLKRLIG